MTSRWVSPLFACAVLLSMVCHGHATGFAQSDDQETKTSVAVLVDISRSFAPLTRPDRDALNELARAIQRAAGTVWEPPVTIFWSTIGNSGVLASNSVCGAAVFHPRMVNRARNDEFSNMSQLQAWFGECVGAVLSRGQHPEAYTDISGSVAIAADSARRVRGRKILAVVSDFAEDLPAGTKATNFELSGENVVLLFRGQSADAQNGNLLLDRMKEWEARLKSAGAKSVCRLPIIGLKSNSIASCF